MEKKKKHILTVLYPWFILVLPFFIAIHLSDGKNEETRGIFAMAYYAGFIWLLISAIIVTASKERIIYIICNIISTAIALPILFLGLMSMA
jgi:hypothetical protein